MHNTDLFNKRKKKATVVFAITLGVLVLILIASILKTSAYNHVRHRETFADSALFSTQAS